MSNKSIPFARVLTLCEMQTFSFRIRFYFLQLSLLGHQLIVLMFIEQKGIVDTRQWNSEAYFNDTLDVGTSCVRFRKLKKKWDFLIEEKELSKRPNNLKNGLTGRIYWIMETEFAEKWWASQWTCLKITVHCTKQLNYSWWVVMKYTGGVYNWEHENWSQGEYKIDSFSLVK